MITQPLVSVVIPTYNRAHTIAETIDSVLDQTYRAVEIVIVDDGSTDNTKQVLKTYGRQIHCVFQSNCGQMAARNRGIQEAQGEIIAFLDSDDLWMPECLETHVRLLRAAPAEVPCSLVNGWLHFAGGRKMTSFENSHLFCLREEGLCLNMPEVLATRFVLFCQFVAVRREALYAAKGFDEDLEFMEDYALPLRLSLLGPWAFTTKPLAVWRQGAADSISVSQRAIQQESELRESLLVIRKRYLEAVAGEQRFDKSRKLQMQALRWDRLELMAINLRNRGHRWWGHLLFNAVRYRKGIFRRGFSYPKMKVVGMPV